MSNNRYFLVLNERRPGQHDTFRVESYAERRTWGERLCDGTHHHFPNDAILAWFDELLPAEEARERADAAWAATTGPVDEALARLIAAHAMRRAACRDAALSVAGGSSGAWESVTIAWPVTVTMGEAG